MSWWSTGACLVSNSGRCTVRIRFIKIICAFFLTCICSVSHAEQQATIPADYYAELTCYNGSVQNVLGVAHLLLDYDAPFPGPADLAALDPPKYNALIDLCSDIYASIHPQLKMTVVNYTGNGRQNTFGCNAHTQCISGFCNSLGNCATSNGIPHDQPSD